MKKILIVAALALLAVAVLYATGNKLSFTRINNPASVQTGTFANSQVDTLFYSRELGVSGLSFGAHFKDTVSVTRVVVRRIIDGEWQAVQAGDTLTNFNAFVNAPNVANPSISVINTVTIDPMPDVYAFIVTYASSANGVTNPNVTYEINKKYSTKQ